MPSDSRELIFWRKITPPANACSDSSKGRFWQYDLADEINARHLDAKCSAGVDAGETAYRRRQTFPCRTHSCAGNPKPIEHEGTYPLPEAQLDRFMLKIRWITDTRLGNCHYQAGFNRLCLRDRAGADR